MKSQATDYLEVMESVYRDACHQARAKVSLRDLRTIRSRVEEEGVSFLTITLPKFCSDFERCLELGFVDSQCFRKFKKHQAGPVFLRGLLSQVFNLETGRINDEVKSVNPLKPVLAVASIRQVCLVYKKIELPCTPVRTRKALGNFVEIERSFDVFQVSGDILSDFTKVSCVLWDSMLHNLCVSELVPRHGPGATADGLSGNRKYTWRTWHARLEPYFPLVGSGYPDSIGELDYDSVELESVDIVHSDMERPVKVTPVPKTLKGPRIIAIEPCCMQFAQQGIRRVLYDLIESHWRTRRHINFRDQSINQSLAMKASADTQLATIDLSDASDRVPHELAKIMFHSNPDMWDAIEACRSTRALLPDGTVIGPLKKFASMGSALCFPIEAMYFYTICVMALIKEYRLPVSKKSVDFAASCVYVYGDDILVPTHAARTVLDHLIKYNCKVNAQKTFVQGNFRESCGVDAFLGEPVNPVYLRRTQPKNRQQASEVISRLSAARQFFTKGYRRTSTLLFKQVEKVLGELPSTTDDSPVLGRNQFSSFSPRKRWNRRLQQFEIRCWTAAPVYRTDELEGYGALMKCLLRLESQKDSGSNELDCSWGIPQHSLENYVLGMVSPLDPLHLSRSALHGAVAIKRRWVPTTTVGLGD